MIHPLNHKKNRSKITFSPNLQNDVSYNSSFLYSTYHLLPLVGLVESKVHAKLVKRLLMVVCAKHLIGHSKQVKHSLIRESLMSIFVINAAYGKRIIITHYPKIRFIYTSLGITRAMAAFVVTVDGCFVKKRKEKRCFI